MDIYNPEFIVLHDGKVNAPYLAHSMRLLLNAGRSSDVTALISDHSKAFSVEGRSIASILLDDYLLIKTALNTKNRQLLRALTDIALQDIQQRSEPAPTSAHDSIKAILFATNPADDYEWGTSLIATKRLESSNAYDPSVFVCDEQFMEKFAQSCSSLPRSLTRIIQRVIADAQMPDNPNGEIILNNLAKGIHAGIRGAVTNDAQMRTGGMVQNFLGIAYHYPLASLRAAILLDPSINPMGLHGVDHCDFTNGIILRSLGEHHGQVTPELIAAIAPISGTGLYGEDLDEYLRLLAETTDADTLPKVLNHTKLQSESGSIIRLSRVVAGLVDGHGRKKDVTEPDGKLSAEINPSVGYASVLNQLEYIFQAAPKVNQLKGLFDVAYQEGEMTRAELHSFEDFVDTAAQTSAGLYDGIDKKNAGAYVAKTMESIARKMNSETPRGRFNREAANKAYGLLFATIDPEIMLYYSRQGRSLRECWDFNRQKATMPALAQNVGFKPILRRSIKRARAAFDNKAA